MKTNAQRETLEKHARRYQRTAAAFAKWAMDAREDGDFDKASYCQWRAQVNADKAQYFLRRLLRLSEYPATSAA